MIARVVGNDARSGSASGSPQILRAPVLYTELSLCPVLYTRLAMASWTALR
jgi:hypothetical protein